MEFFLCLILFKIRMLNFICPYFVNNFKVEKFLIRIAKLRIELKVILKKWGSRKP